MNVKKIIKNIFWHPIRKRSVIIKQRKAIKFWEPVIDNYLKGRLPKYNFSEKKQLSSDKIIWQYWGQGFSADKLPTVVKLAFESVDKYKGDYTVIRIDDTSIKNYVDIPNFVYEKLQKGYFNRTFFLIF